MSAATHSTIYYPLQINEASVYCNRLWQRCCRPITWHSPVRLPQWKWQFPDRVKVLLIPVHDTFWLTWCTQLMCTWMTIEQNLSLNCNIYHCVHDKQCPTTSQNMWNNVWSKLVLVMLYTAPRRINCLAAAGTMPIALVTGWWVHSHRYLTHWDGDKIDAISKTTFSSTFSWI